MANPTPSPERDDRPRGGLPRWAIVLGILAAVGLLGLMIALHLSGTFGPGTH